ncbi:MAG: MBL fold metallo-hydrolase, partial [Acidobacteriota bacterium]
MRHRSGITLAAASCVAALLLVTASAAGRADRVAASEPATGLVQLTARAWAFVAEDERSSNGALFVGDHAALIVDPGLTPAVASAFLAAVHSVTDRPIRRVVLTHWHPDHSLGITCLGLPDLDIVAHPLTRRALAENGAMARASLASRAPSPEEATALSDCRPALPRPLGPDDARIDLGGLTVEVFHPGLAHTRGDLVVWSPDESVLVTGDILMNGSCPSMGEGDTLSWLGVLSDLEKLAPAHVVPGHFAPGDTSTVTRFRAYLQAQVDHARDSIDAGLSADASARTAHFAAFAS